MEYIYINIIHTHYTYIITNPNDFEPPLPCLILDDAGHQPALRAAHVLRFNDNLIQPRCFVFGCHGYFGAVVLFRLEHWNSIGGQETFVCKCTKCTCHHLDNSQCRAPWAFHLMVYIATCFEENIAGKRSRSATAAVPSGKTVLFDSMQHGHSNQQSRKVLYLPPSTSFHCTF